MSRTTCHIRMASVPSWPSLPRQVLPEGQEHQAAPKQDRFYFGIFFFSDHRGSCISAQSDSSA